jgi:uncharacterized protein YraI
VEIVKVNKMEHSVKSWAVVLSFVLVSCASNNISQVSPITASNCNAEINGNIRSEPSSQAGSDTVVGSGGTLPVTGIKTESGWIQLKRPNDVAWVYSEKISNFSQLQNQSCFKDTVGDTAYIKSQPKVKSVDL